MKIFLKILIFSLCIFSLVLSCDDSPDGEVGASSSSINNVLDDVVIDFDLIPLSLTDGARLTYAGEGGMIITEDGESEEYSADVSFQVAVDEKTVDSKTVNALTVGNIAVTAYEGETEVEIQEGVDWFVDFIGLENTEIYLDYTDMGLCLIGGTHGMEKEDEESSVSVYNTETSNYDYVEAVYTSFMNTDFMFDGDGYCLIPATFMQGELISGSFATENGYSYVDPTDSTIVYWGSYSSIEGTLSSELSDSIQEITTDLGTYPCYVVTISIEATVYGSYEDNRELTPSGYVGETDITGSITLYFDETQGIIRIELDAELDKDYTDIDTPANSYSFTTEESGTFDLVAVTTE